MYSLLFNTIGKFIPLNAQEKETLMDFFSFRQVPKRFKLAEEGKVAKEIYFINKGLLRLFYSKEGEEITGYIFREGLFASSYDSFLREVSSIQTLECLEDSELLVISKTDLDTLYQRMPAMNILTRKVAEQRFINAQLILSSFILDSPEERYRKFAKDNSDLLNRVPQHYIASFLGITPVSLSRIRKRLMTK